MGLKGNETMHHYNNPAHQYLLGGSQSGASVVDPCAQQCGQRFPSVEQYQQYLACMAGCGPQRSLPQRPALGLQQPQRPVPGGGCAPEQQCSLPGVCCPFGTRCKNNVCYPVPAVGECDDSNDCFGDQLCRAGQCQDPGSLTARPGTQPGMPRPPTRSLRKQRRAIRHAARPTGQRMLTAQTPGRQQNPVWPWVVGGVALAGAGLYGAVRCAPGMRHEERTSQVVEGITIDLVRTLEYKGCFQENSWVAQVNGTMSAAGQTEEVHYQKAFEDKDEAMEWLYPEELEDADKVANPSATAQAVMARRRNPEGNPVYTSGWPEEQSTPYFSQAPQSCPPLARMGNPRGRGKQPRGISLKTTPADLVRNWFFMPSKDRKARMAKYSPTPKPSQRSLPTRLSTRRLANP